MAVNRRLFQVTSKSVPTKWDRVGEFKTAAQLIKEKEEMKGNLLGADTLLFVCFMKVCVLEAALRYEKQSNSRWLACNNTKNEHNLLFC